MTAQPLRILVTGSREWQDLDAIEAALRDAWAAHGGAGRETVVVHGGAVGADSCAGFLAACMGFTVEVHPADWSRLGRAAGPIRNTTMVQLGADIALAFPIGRSPGTRDCVQRARAAGIPTIVHGEPDSPIRS